jgi:hypothetical protein
MLGRGGSTGGRLGKGVIVGGGCCDSLRDRLKEEEVLAGIGCVWVERRVEYECVRTMCGWRGGWSMSV